MSEEQKKPKATLIKHKKTTPTAETKGQEAPEKKKIVVVKKKKVVLKTTVAQKAKTETKPAVQDDGSDHPYPGTVLPLESSSRKRQGQKASDRPALPENPHLLLRLRRPLLQKKKILPKPRAKNSSRVKRKIPLPKQGKNTKNTRKRSSLRLRRRRSKEPIPYPKRSPSWRT
jgi:hypothetical protein